jgi:predicted nuclease with TOPRIM domain
MSSNELIFILIAVILLIAVGILIFLLIGARTQAKADEANREALKSLNDDLKNKLKTVEKSQQELTKANFFLEQQLTAVNNRYNEYSAKFQGVISVDEERSRILEEIGQLHEKHAEFIQQYNDDYDKKKVEAYQIEQQITQLQKEFALLDEAANLQSFAFYTPRYGFDSSSRYQIELDRIRRTQKEMISNKTAAICSAEWTINGSRAEGRKQSNQILKLVLRAFNGESDAAIAKVRYNNVHVMEARILKAFDMLNSLITVQQAEITRNYLNSKLEELYLVHEYNEKIQEEKEEQRRIKEQMREEEVARREIEKALQETERDESRYAEALRKAREEVEKSVGEKQAKYLAQIETLQQKLAEVQANKERAISRAQMTRSGHVYVISNVGSFGEDVYKIGMTRRLEPMDRVNELGDASVPFKFDVHAIIYCEDAPTLENKLHRKFENRRINLVNSRREFFRVSINEIANAVREFHGEIDFTMLAEAKEYRLTLARLSENQNQITLLDNSDILEINP